MITIIISKSNIAHTSLMLSVLKKKLSTEINSLALVTKCFHELGTWHN